MALPTCILTLLGALTAALSAMLPGPLDAEMARHGMTDVRVADPRIEVALMYGGSDNFTGVTLYDGLTRAWLRPEAAAALHRAQEALTAEDPTLHLKVYDAARPMSVQQHMHDVVAGTPQAHYVSNPRNGGGLHNYGLAVDLTIARDDGTELDMGTAVDHLGPLAGNAMEHTLTPGQRANRALLRRAMAAGGYRQLPSEWWHYNLCSRAEARSRYTPLNF